MVSTSPQDAERMLTGLCLIPGTSISILEVAKGVRERVLSMEASGLCFPSGLISLQFADCAELQGGPSVRRHVLIVWEASMCCIRSNVILGAERLRKMGITRIHPC